MPTQRTPKPAAKKPQARRKNTKPPAKRKKLPKATERRYRMFAMNYIIDYNGTRAYQEVYGTNARVAGVNAARLLADARMQEIVDELIDKRAQQVGIEANDALRLIWQTATADANELVEFRRLCCRHCWSKNHKYQFTQSEWDRILETYNRDLEEAKIHTRPPPKKPDPLGGVGFNKLVDPNPDCPECFGEGIPDVHIKDTRKLSPAARQLYAGVKQTREGLEVKMHSRDKNLDMLARSVGLLKNQMEHTGPNGGAIPHEMTINFVGSDD